MKESKPVVHVFYGFDERYVPFAGVSIASLVSHCSEERNYVIHILHTDISKESQEKLFAFERKNVYIRFEDVNEEMRNLVSALPVRDYYSVSTYFRLLIAEKFPRLEKALYLDGDTILRRDVAELFDTDLGSAWVGGVTDCVVTENKPCFDYVKYALGIEPKKYINAGMMLINVKAWKENAILDRFLSLFSFYSFKVAQDQDYLNVLLKGKIKYLSRKWNMEALHTWKIRSRDIGLIHYNFASKPWHDLTAPYAFLFWEEAEKSPFTMEIKKEFCFYTDAQKEAERRVGANVLSACLDEVKNPDNFQLKLARLQETEESPVLEEIPLFLKTKNA